MYDSDNTKSISRRSVLRSVGGAGSSLALLNTASVTEASEHYDSYPEVEKYESKQVVSEAVQSGGAEILDGLAEQGLITEPSVSALPLDTFIKDAEILSATDEKEGFAVSWIVTDDGPTVHITVSLNTANYGVAFVIQPEVGNAHAFIAPRTDEEEKQLLTTTDSGGVSVESICHTYKECSSEQCYCWATAGYYYVYKYECYSSVDSACTDNCKLVGKSCPDECYCSVCAC